MSKLDGSMKFHRTIAAFLRCLLRSLALTATVGLLGPAVFSQLLRNSPPRLQPNAGSGPAASKTELDAKFAPFASSLRVLSTREVKNTATMTSPMVLTLQQQKQLGDIEASQVMSAGTNQSGINLAGRAPTTLRAPVNSSPVSTMGRATAPVCLSMTSIVAVNQKKTGVIFTPDSRYNLYTVNGCGFGNTQGAGKLYLDAGPGGFPAHSGKIGFKIRTWTDHLIVAMVDPTVTGELDQNNVSLAVDTAMGGHAQANGFSFYAVRGPQMQLPHIPEADASGVGSFVSPCGAWGLNGCTAEFFAEGTSVYPGNHYVDNYTPKLKPGFVLTDAVVLVGYLQPDTSTSVNTWEPQFSGGTVKVTRQLYKYPNASFYYSLYGIRLYVVGPAGISNPLADAN